MAIPYPTYPPPPQLGMTLMKPPRRPTMSELQGIARHFRTSHGSVHETWQPYLGMKPADE